MPGTTVIHRSSAGKSWLDRTLSLFTEVRAGEGATAALMLVNIFLLLVCYSVIKTVREPLILLGGGAEVRSYTAAGQALLLIAFVPAYSRFASRVGRARLLVGVTLFFVACIELFAAAVAARVPYVGVAFFIWAGIFNISLVAQFWSFANDIYSKDAGDRLFPVIVLGMTAGAPIGSFVSGHLFRLGFTPQAILQLSAVLLAITVLLYLVINRRTGERGPAAAPLSAEGGFQLVLASPYLRLVALLIVLLNVVNTTGEYLISRLLTVHVTELAAVTPGFDKQAFIGAYAGDYQFWVNVTAVMLQAFVAARLVKYRGLAGVLFALPLLALGGYAVIAAGVGFSVTRWIKTAENATDYSIMNTARQLLWLPTSREEKYKAKQAIDTFFVRGGDLLSAAIVYIGTAVLHLTVRQFAAANVALTIGWLGVAALILKPRRVMPRIALRPVVTAAAAAMLVLLAALPAAAQSSREDQLAAERAEKATSLHPYEPDGLERNIARLETVFMSPRDIYAFVGSAFDGGGLAVGPGFRKRFGDTGSFDAHAAVSIRRFKTADALLTLPQFATPRLTVQLHGNWLDAPSLAFFGVGNDTPSVRRDLAVRTTTIGASVRMQAAEALAFGAGVDSVALRMPAFGDANYARTHVSAEYDTRTSPSYSRRGGLYRLELSDYRQLNGHTSSFRRVDAEVDRFVPILRENWVIALRALASTTDVAAGNTVPYFFLPDLGGSHTLRGYPTWRFRDRNRMLFTGEYRWTAGSFVDMALFLDAGKVAPRFGDLNLRGLNRTYGIGMSLHTPTHTIARIEFARTREGNSLSMSFSPSF